jgi:CDGSH-type Zn-finger protein
MENTGVKITAIPNGPLLVEGMVLIKKTDGTEETKDPKCHLCRCGHSANKPFCDGTHKKIGFIG